MIAALIALMLADAGPPPRCHGVGLAAMVARYGALTRAGDARRIARLYGRDGVLVGDHGAPITGAYEVEAYLTGFAGYHVASDLMTIETMTATEAGWHVGGHYVQAGTTPGGAGYDVKGVFHADWACRRTGWQVKRMATA